MLRSLPVTLCLAVTLAGCSAADPDAELATDVEAVIAAANDRDSGGVREQVDELLQTISSLGGTGRLTPAREAELRTLALAVLENVALLDAQPSPSPVPSPSLSPSPSPRPSRPPAPSPRPSPSPSPSPAEAEKEDDDDDDKSPRRHRPRRARARATTSHRSSSSRPDLSGRLRGSGGRR